VDRYGRYITSRLKSTRVGMIGPIWQVPINAHAHQDDEPNLAGTTATCFPVPFHALSFTHKHLDLNTLSLTPCVHSKLMLVENKVFYFDVLLHDASR